MKGTILQFDRVKGGVISGTDGNRYFFGANETASNQRLCIPGTEVDFEPSERNALDLILLKKSGREKKRSVAILLAVFFGPLGADRFYLQRRDEGQAILGLFLVILIGNNLLFGAGQGTNLIWLAFLAFGWVRAAIYMTKSDQQFFESYLSADVGKKAGTNA